MKIPSGALEQWLATILQTDLGSKVQYYINKTKQQVVI